METYKSYNVRKVRESAEDLSIDVVTTESALAIYLIDKDNPVPYQLSITMRTPGEDEILALGFIFNEGIIHSMNDVATITKEMEDVIIIKLNVNYRDGSSQDKRYFLSNSSCGVCGKSSIEDAMRVRYKSISNSDLTLTKEVVFSLQEKLRINQNEFNQTGGLHAVGLFDIQGNLLAVCEDIGRHNALDKMIGQQLMKGKLPLSNSVLLLSGRIAYELVQKSLMAGVPIMVAIGAPSSLSVDISRKNNQTLVGFLKKNGFNIYSGEDRILMD